MRAVRRRRPLNRDKAPPPSATRLALLAERATYLVSTEHKDHLTEAGPGGLRSDATPCPKHSTQATAELWLRRAIANGDVGGPWSDQPYPRYAWFRDGDAVYEARVSNVELGAYKGYPLSAAEAPGWLE